MNNWKDFLYYSKAEKLSIILFLILICCVLGLLIFLCNFSNLDLSYYKNEEKSKQDFTNFVHNLEDDIVLNDSVIEATQLISQSLPKNTSKKLKIGESIDINSASIQLLIKVPGIGQTLAQRIIDYRTDLGGFYQVDQLCEIKGITVKKFSQILPYCQVKKTHKRLNINKTAIEKLSIHPYLKNYINDIIELRNSETIVSIDQLRSFIYLEKDLEKINQYITFN